MPTPTARLGLLKHTTADRFRIAEYAQNWERLDDYVGWYVCTSTSRPASWGSAQEGMAIWEIDRKLAWVWNGSAFERFGPVGWLNSTYRTTDISNGTTTLATAVQTNAVVPAGGRKVAITVEGPGVASSVGLTTIALLRDATQIRAWTSQGGTGATAGEQPRPLSFTAIDTPAAGTYTYALKFAAVDGFGGTSTLRATSTNPVGIHVVEI